MYCLCRSNPLRSFANNINDLKLIVSHPSPTLIHLHGNSRSLVRGLLPRQISSSSGGMQQDTLAAVSHEHSLSNSVIGGGRVAKSSLSDAPSYASGFDDKVKGNSEAAIMEITPEVLDTLASESKKVTILVDSLAASSKEEREREVDGLANSQTEYDDKAKTVTSRDPRKRPRHKDNEAKAASPDVRITYGTRSQADWNTLISKNGRADKLGSRGTDSPFPKKENWMIQKASLKAKFPEGWKPRKRLSPDAMEGIRALHLQEPNRYTSWALAEQFKVSPEAIRKILKSRWKPNSEEAESRTLRWHRRGQQVWSRYAEMGVKPPVQWRKGGATMGAPEGMRRLDMDDVDIPTTTRRNDSHADAYDIEQDLDGYDTELGSNYNDLSERMI